MNKKDVQSIGDRLFEVMSWWNNGIDAAKAGYLLMGKSIFHLKKEKLWRVHTEHMPSFKYWVEHELHISLAQANRLAQIYSELGHILAELPIEISKVTLLLPHLHDKTDDQKKDMLSMAQNCTIEDIKNNIKDMEGEGNTTDTCLHLNTELVSRCRDCNKWLK